MLRLSGGLVLVREARKVDHPARSGLLVDSADDVHEVRVLFGETGEVSLGGTPLPGLVVGGRLSQTFAVGDKRDVAMLTLGPFVDWYFDPRRGFHVLGGPSVALTTALAWGGFLGAGYEGWISDGWSLGALFRIDYVRWNENTNTVHDLIAPSISFAATFDR